MPLEEAEVSCIITNRRSAGVREVARQHMIQDIVWSRSMLQDEKATLSMLIEHDIDMIVLAGWLTLIPAYLVDRFPKRIINIHPALLPKYGGKGMYGHHVHQAVKDAGELETGITIHYVNDQYDDGAIILQAQTPLAPSDTPEEIANKVQVLEHKYYPIVVEELVKHDLP